MFGIRVFIFNGGGLHRLIPIMRAANQGVHLFQMISHSVLGVMNIDAGLDVSLAYSPGAIGSHAERKAVYAKSDRSSSTQIPETLRTSNYSEPQHAADHRPRISLNRQSRRDHLADL